jgi:hypothetical protein
MRRRSSPVIGLAALALGACGCATVFHGSTQKIQVFTDPPEATVTAGSQQITSPGQLRLPRKGETIEIRVEKEGYASRTVVLQRKVSGLVWLNLVWAPAGAVVGAAVDTTSGLDCIFGCREEEPSGTPYYVAGGAATAGGMAVDFATGGAYRLDPPTVVVRLLPLESGGDATSGP